MISGGGRQIAGRRELYQSIDIVNYPPRPVNGMSAMREDRIPRKPGA
jgi:hypothetical protein